MENGKGLLDNMMSLRTVGESYCPILEKNPKMMSKHTINPINKIQEKPIINYSIWLWGWQNNSSVTSLLPVLKPVVTNGSRFRNVP